MKRNVVIMVAENEDEDFFLIRKGLQLAGVYNSILRFSDSKEILAFLFGTGTGLKRQFRTAYLLLLGLNLDGGGGIDVLKQIKQNDELKKIPVIVLGAADSSSEAEYCIGQGSNMYVGRPANDDAFVEAIQKIGFFLSVIEVPPLTGPGERG
jgi:CheY-like chemotaxis protein